MFVPGVWERMTEGFTSDTHDSSSHLESSSSYVSRSSSNVDVDLYTVTSGRTFAWPFVIDEIMEAPLIGYGKEAMKRTGLSRKLWAWYSESFPHPHNAYLQLIMDNGIIGGIPILLFYFFIVKFSMILFMDSSNPIYVACGGVALALVLALLVASLGSQTFYPREGAVGMWCAIGLMLRVYVEREKLIEKQQTAGIEANGMTAA
jgi:hypothetical protein